MPLVASIVSGGCDAALSGETAKSGFEESLDWARGLAEKAWGIEGAARTLKTIGERALRLAGQAARRGETDLAFLRWALMRDAARLCIALDRAGELPARAEGVPMRTPPAVEGAGKKADAPAGGKDGRDAPVQAERTLAARDGAGDALGGPDAPEDPEALGDAAVRCLETVIPLSKRRDWITTRGVRIKPDVHQRMARAFPGDRQRFPIDVSLDVLPFVASIVDDACTAAAAEGEAATGGFAARLDCACALVDVVRGGGDVEDMFLEAGADALRRAFAAVRAGTSDLSPLREDLVRTWGMRCAALTGRDARNAADGRSAAPVDGVPDGSASGIVPGAAGQGVGEDGTSGCEEEGYGWAALPALAPADASERRRMILGEARRCLEEMSPLAGCRLSRRERVPLLMLVNRLTTMGTRIPRGPAGGKFRTSARRGRFPVDVALDVVPVFACIADSACRIARSGRGAGVFAKLLTAMCRKALTLWGRPDVMEAIGDFGGEAKRRAEEAVQGGGDDLPVVREVLVMEGAGRCLVLDAARTGGPEAGRSAHPDRGEEGDPGDPRDPCRMAA
jgi:hypothetical protein